MLLTSKETATRGIIVDGVELEARATTYDATVGSIVRCGVAIQPETFVLEPRAIVWVISRERFRLPASVTGLATLRTTWTHNGVLALNVGIVDPGHFGPLATAIVNFSNSAFSITKGDAFFRIMFHEHADTGVSEKIFDVTSYTARTVAQSRQFSKTFLNMETLIDEVSAKVLGIPKFAYILTIAGILIAIIAIFVPISFSVWTDYHVGRTRIDDLQRQLDDLKTERGNTKEIGELKERLSASEQKQAEQSRILLASRHRRSHPHRLHTGSPK